MDPTAPGLIASNEAGSPPTGAFLSPDGSTTALLAGYGAAINAERRSTLTSGVPFSDTLG